MKNTQRWTALLLAVLLALSLLSVSAVAEGGEEPPASGVWQCPETKKDETGKWDYGVLEDGTAVITGFTVESSTLKIPDEVDGIPVTMVARDPAVKVDYNQIHAIKKVVFPKGLKAVEQQAFEGCTALTKVELPKGLETIGYAAFKNCKELTSIGIPASVMSIGDEAFSNCSKLTFPTLPEGLIKIGKRTFYQCRKLGKVKLPVSVRVVEEEAFASCLITSITLNEGLEEICDSAFLAHRLGEIVFPASLKKIGNAAFDPERGKTLKKITFKSASTEPGAGVFGYDDGWAEFYEKLQNGQTDLTKEDYDKKDPQFWIDYYRDPGNFGQNELTITCYPGSRADELYQYHVSKTYLKGSEDNAMTAPAERVLQAGLYTNEDRVYELVIPEGVEEIADSAFTGLTTLNKITLPASLTRIGAHAFEGCVGLKDVVVQGKTMAEIGEAAFKGCSELKAMVVPEGVTEIGNETFAECRKMAKLTLPKAGLLRIGDRAFAECKALTELKLNAGLESIGKETFRSSGVTNLQIPDSVTTIGDRAFYLSALKSLKFPADMEEITDSLCAYSFNLAKVTLPKTLKRIGNKAFMRCQISGLNLPEGLESIGEEAFAFDVSNAVTMYGRKRTYSKLRSLKIPSTLKTIGKAAFIANDGLTSITIPKNAQLEEIGDSAFEYCFRLQKIDLPDSLRKIGNAAFRKCQSMTSVNLGGGVTELGDDVFNYCIKMTKLTAPDTLEKIGKDVFKEHNKKLKVTVPGGEMYRYIWSNYRGIQLVTPKKK